MACLMDVSQFQLAQAACCSDTRCNLYGIEPAQLFTTFTTCWADQLSSNNQQMQLGLNCTGKEASQPI